MKKLLPIVGLIAFALCAFMSCDLAGMREDKMYFFINSSLYDFHVIVNGAYLVEKDGTVTTKLATFDLDKAVNGQAVEGGKQTVVYKGSLSKGAITLTTGGVALSAAARNSALEVSGSSYNIVYVDLGDIEPNIKGAE